MSSLSKVKMSSLPIWQTGFAKLYDKREQNEGRVSCNDKQNKSNTSGMLGFPITNDQLPLTKYEIC